MVAKIIGALIGYWLVGMIIVFLEARTRREMFRVIGACFLAFFWLPVLAMEFIEWSSSSTKIDFDEDGKKGDS